MHRRAIAQRTQIEEYLKSRGISQGGWVRSAHLQRAEPQESGGFDWVLTTERPVTVWDWQRYELVDEILLVEGMIPPPNEQAVLLDSHNRFSVKDVLGHVSDFAETQAGEYRGVTGQVFFADDPDSAAARQKVEGGHITDGSVGYSVIKSVWVPEGEQASVKGKIYEGPVRVVYEWLLREFSITPIGADVLAKVRYMCGKRP